MKVSEESKLFNQNHPYYCEEDKYYYKTPNDGWGADLEYNSVKEYLADWGDSDTELNFLFRWDWEYLTPSEYEKEYCDKLEQARGTNKDGDYSVIKIFYILQRKGCRKNVFIYGAEKSEESELRSHLERHWKTMRETWSGVSDFKNN